MLIHAGSWKMLGAASTESQDCLGVGENSQREKRSQLAGVAAGRYKTRLRRLVSGALFAEAKSIGSALNSSGDPEKRGCGWCSGAERRTAAAR